MQVTQKCRKWFAGLSTTVIVELKGAELHSIKRWVSVLIEPLAYFFLFAVSLASNFDHAHYLRFIVPGLIAVQAVRSMGRIIYRATIERRWGLAALKLQFGIPASAYLLGMLVVPLVVFLVQALVMIASAAVTGIYFSVPQIALLLVACVITSPFWSLLGFTLTGIISNYQTRDFVVSLIVFPLMFSAPTFYSLDRAPDIIQWISRINPLTYQVELLRACLTGDWNTPLVAVCVVFTLLMGAATYFSVRKLRLLSFEA